MANPFNPTVDQVAAATVRSFDAALHREIEAEIRKIVLAQLEPVIVDVSKVLARRLQVAIRGQYDVFQAPSIELKVDGVAQSLKDIIEAGEGKKE